MNNHLTVAFDVDSTLITQDPTTGRDVPNHKVLDLFRTYSDLGCQMVIWSGSGEDYAEQWRDKLGLQATILRKGSVTVDIAVDDQQVVLGKINIQI